MKKIFLALSVIALVSCGTPKKAPDDPSNDPSGGTGTGNGDSTSHSLTPDQLRSQCGQLKGFVVPDGSICLLGTTVLVPDGQPAGRVTIIQNAQAGRYLVTAGTNGGVIVIWNGQQVGNANTRIPISVPGGAIEFQVLNPNASKAAATIYECRDRNMSFVICPANEIP